jgi:hypothetical protein
MRSVRGSPKCGKTLLSANQVTSAMPPSARVSTTSRRNRIRRREGLVPASKGTDRILLAEDEQRLKGA